MRSLTIAAPAKVNLYLGVGECRPDGYHDVTTIFHALELADTVYIIPADELTVTTSVDLGIPESENLAFRAAQLFAEEFGQPMRCVIEIEKRIPAGAGLAGGSSDAAAVIVGLARLTGVDPLDERCLAVARELGADCAFFLSGGAALMGGRGDELIRRLPAMVVDVALVKPAAPVPTGDAYAAFDRAPAITDGPEAVMAALLADDAAVLGVSLSNNLTAASSSLVPEVIDALVWVRAQPGVLGAAMAGSGSAVFAICAGPHFASAISEGARARGWWGKSTTTRPVGVMITDDEGRE